MSSAISRAASYKESISDVGFVALNVHVEPDAVAAATSATSASNSAIASATSASASATSAGAAATSATSLISLLF